MVHKPVTIQYNGAEHTYLSKDVYFTSKQDLGQPIASSQIKSMRCDTPFKHEVEKEAMSHIKMSDGTYSRTYTLYDMPKSITAAWIGNLFGIANEVHIWFKPVKPSAARRMLLTHANTLEARIGRRHLEEAQQARQINDMIQSQETVAYTVNVTAVISAASAKELRKACKEFEKTAGWRSIRCMAVSGKQLDTLMGWGHEFMFDLGSCTVFHPFASSRPDRGRRGRRRVRGSQRDNKSPCDIRLHQARQLQHVSHWRVRFRQVNSDEDIRGQFPEDD